MEFLGAIYYEFNYHQPIQGADKKIFRCKRYHKTKSGGYQTGYNFFGNEIRPQIKKENPKSSVGHLNSLVSKAWQNLPANQRTYYDRKSAESRSSERVTVKCQGQVTFKVVNGKIIVSEDGLMEYVPHSERFSIETDLLKL